MWDLSSLGLRNIHTQADPSLFLTLFSHHCWPRHTLHYLTMPIHHPHPHMHVVLSLPGMFLPTFLPDVKSLHKWLFRRAFPTALQVSQLVFLGLCHTQLIQSSRALTTTNRTLVPHIRAGTPQCHSLLGVGVINALSNCSHAWPGLSYALNMC